MIRRGMRFGVGMTAIAGLVFSGVCLEGTVFAQQSGQSESQKGSESGQKAETGSTKKDAPPSPKLGKGKDQEKKDSGKKRPLKKPLQEKSTTKPEGKGASKKPGSQSGGKKKADKTNASGKKSGKKKAAPKPVEITPISDHLKSVILGEKDATLNDFRGMQKRVNQLVSKLRPSVVGIRSGSGQGTGVIVTSDGLVLTAAHVIGKRGRPATVVMPDGSTRRAIAMGTISRADSGMLRILEKGEYPYVDVGESGPLNEGQWVMALGHPGGFDKERESPVRVGRMLVKPGKTTLQTDCTLVGGDSGGPLFDMNGSLIGIHSRIAARIQQNFHVSIDYFTDNWDSMLEELKPYLGFSLNKGKMTISKVEGPAQGARMKKGDLLLKLGKFEVKSRDDIKKALKSFKFDQRIEVVVKRDNEEKKLRLRIGGK